MARRRKIVNIPGLNRSAPIPDGVRIGNLVFSSALTGTDPPTQSLPTEPERQAEQLFRNMRSFIETAGGTIDDIAHVTLYLKEGQARAPFDQEWEKMFPDPDDRPARHRIALNLRGDLLFQVELIAVLAGAG